MMSRRAALGLVIAVILGSILTAAAFTVMKPEGMQRQVLAAIRPAGLEACDAGWYPRGLRVDCYVEEVASLLEQSGPAALTAVVQRADHSSAFRDSCHAVMHDATGRYASALELDRAALVRDLPTSGDPNCVAGYVHALMLEFGSRSRPSELPVLAPACQALTGGLAQRNCVHGIGHAAIAATRGNLDEAVATCTALGAAGADCAPGVYHQHFDRTARVEGQSANAARTCAVRQGVPSSFRTACWARALEYRDRSSDRYSTFERGFQTCARLDEPADRAPCVTAVQFISSNRVHPIAKLRRCIGLPAWAERSCILGGPYAFGGDRGKDLDVLTRALTTCAAFSPATGAVCARQVAHELGTFVDEAAAVRACAAAPAGLRHGCRAGAAATGDPLGIW